MFQRLTKLESEKFTTAYLFQIAQEKSCNYLLIIYMTKFRLILLNRRNAKDLIGHLWVSLIIDQSECLVCFLLLHWINSFLHCFKKTALFLTNQNGEIFSCILLREKYFMICKQKKATLSTMQKWIDIKLQSLSEISVEIPVQKSNCFLIIMLH